MRIHYTNGAYLGDAERDVDGMYYLWMLPPEHGSHTSHSLRWLADKLDELNEPYQKELDAYFSKEQSDGEKTINTEA